VNSLVKLAVRDVVYNFEVAAMGAERPLLLLHGFTGSSRNWEPLLPYLVTQRQIIAVDLLGHGRSPSPPRANRYSIELIAADMLDLLDQLAIEQADILGYSMGGRLALYLATQAPQRVSALILESASPGLKSKDEQLTRRQHDNALAERIEKEGLKAFVDYWESLPLWASQAGLPAETRETLRQQRLQNDPVGLAYSLRGLGTGAQASQWGRLHRLPMPVLLLAGELDEKFVAINQEMAALIPGAQLEIVPGAGHAIHLERPLLYGELIRNFLQNSARNDQQSRPRR
jgi:2-succinyl-6-hydroxy-2,4-cyclohexadiene-1-carboxylate synthase